MLAAVALCLARLPVAAAAPANTEPTFGCATPAEDMIHLNLSNPGPGDTVPAGNMVLHGLAFDRMAQSSAGVDRVSVFLDNRNAGGTHLADATLGEPNPFAAMTDAQFANAAWSAVVGIPNQPGLTFLVVKAHSAVTDHESAVSLPIVIGQDSMPGQACSATSTAVTNAVTPAASMHLELSNPSEGAAVKVGAFQLQGIAFDRAAETGTGIDRVSIFLDNRDTGGIHLADATLLDEPIAGHHGVFQATVNIPDEIADHTLYAYAHSAVSGHDTWVSVPISVVR